MLLKQITPFVPCTQLHQQIQFYHGVLRFDVGFQADNYAVYAAMKDKLDRLPTGRVRVPFDQDYGQREFHVSDEDCTLIFYGAPSS